MEATALSIGKSALNGVVSYANSAIAEEVALQLGVQRDQAFITDELEMMQSFLMAAHDERDDNKVVQTWVKQVRDVSYNVEDCLMDFAVRLQKQTWWRIPRTLQTRHRVAMEMKELRDRVEDVSQRNIRYRLIKGSGSKPAITVSGATMSADDEARRQHNKAKMDLVGLINSKDDDLKVIALWGTSDISIIRSAYEDQNIHKKFDCCAWIRSIRPFKQTDFIRSILRQFYVTSLRKAKEGEKSIFGPQVLEMMETTKEDSLADEFKGYLDTKSYLIVLDDIHTIGEWNSIKAYFPSNNKGSRIIVLTEQVEVASLCVGAENRAPEHKKLFDDKSLYAFYKKGSEDGTGSAEAGSSSDTDSSSIDSSADQDTLTPIENIVTSVEAGSISDTDSSSIDSSADQDTLTPIENIVTSAESEFGLIGRQSEEHNIIKQVLDRDVQRFQVLSVWGMGGIGKTILARSIYQNKKITNAFEKRACVTIMHPFNRDDLLNSLVESFEEKNSSNHPESNHFQEKSSTEKSKSKQYLEKCLGGKQYLLVLDDMWATSEWDVIYDILPKTVGSCIIITTREENIAKHCSEEPRNIYKLSSLGPRDALILFTKKVFKENVNLYEQYPELVKQAELILKKCGGLPLALVTVGGFLASQPKTVLEWKKFNDHIIAELEMNPELGAIKAILTKSYDGLPYHLKACFLYLAIFPEDYMIARRRLVRRWIAEGYSHEMRGKSADELLDGYLMELISRTMILPSQQSIYSRKGIDSCQVHDLISEIAISKSMEENLVLRLEAGSSSNTKGIARHLAISSSWEGDKVEFESIVDLSRVRSLTVFGKWRSFFMSDKMRLLRVLDLEDAEGLVDHHLERIGELLHLRYLSLRGCGGIYHLPDSVGNLRQLDTLDITGTHIAKLPRTIIKLKGLQHILGSNMEGGFNEEDFPKLFRNKLRILTTVSAKVCYLCCTLKHGNDAASRRDVCTSYCCSILPSAMSGQIKGGVRLPRGIRKLKALRTLPTVDISVGKAILEDIKRLARLRKLGVIGINKTNGQSLCSAVAPLSCLESLSLRPDREQSLSGCLDGPSSPPENLQSLKLYGELVKLPEWIQRLKSLVKLKLQGSRITEHHAAMKILGDLPYLATLRLLHDSFVGERLGLSFGREAFQSLKALELRILPALVFLKFEEGATPKLESLRCFSTEEKIRFFGVVGLRPTIKEFMLHSAGTGRDTDLVE